MAPALQPVERRHDLPGTGPYSVATGLDGLLWVTLAATGEVARLAPDGTVDRVRLGDRPGVLAADRDGVWCAVTGEDLLIRVDAGLHPHPVRAPGGPYGVAVTPYGATWCTLLSADALGHVTADGDLVTVPLPRTGGFPAMIAARHDGGVVAALNQAGALVVRQPTGGLETIDLPEGSKPVGVALDGDTVWTADIGGDRVVRIDADGMHPVQLGDGARPHAVAVDAAGACWVTAWGAGTLVRIDPSGTVDELDLSPWGAEPHGVAIDERGTAWVALESGVVLGVAADR